MQTHTTHKPPLYVKEFMKRGSVKAQTTVVFILMSLWHPQQ